MFPLDGGQALLHGTRLAMGRTRRAITITKWISLGTSVAVALWGFDLGQHLHFDHFIVECCSVLAVGSSFKINGKVKGEFFQTTPSCAAEPGPPTKIAPSATATENPS